MPRISIVGQKFRGLDPYLPGTFSGTPVLLVREPDNPHDINAIAVWIDGKHVGYIPKAKNVALGRLMDQVGREQAVAKSGLAADSSKGHAMRVVMNATFARSPNTSYPQIEIGESV